MPPASRDLILQVRSTIFTNPPSLATSARTSSLNFSSSRSPRMSLVAWSSRPSTQKLHGPKHPGPLRRALWPPRRRRYTARRALRVVHSPPRRSPPHRGDAAPHPVSNAARMMQIVRSSISLSLVRPGRNTDASLLLTRRRPGPQSPSPTCASAPAHPPPSWNQGSVCPRRRLLTLTMVDARSRRLFDGHRGGERSRSRP